MLDHRGDVVAAAFGQELLQRGDVGAVLRVLRPVDELGHQILERGLADHNILRAASVKAHHLSSKFAARSVHHDVLARSGRLVDISFDELETKARGDLHVEHRLARDHHVAVLVDLVDEYVAVVRPSELERPVGVHGVDSVCLHPAVLGDGLKSQRRREHHYQYLSHCNLIGA